MSRRAVPYVAVLLAVATLATAPRMRAQQVEATKTTIQTALSAKELGLVLPANVYPGEWLSAAVMPGAAARNYNGVPGLVVKTFTVPMPQAPPAGSPYAGLRIGVSGGDYAPADAGWVSIKVPSSSTFRIQAMQQDDPSSATSFDYAITRPSYADSEFLRLRSPAVQEIQETMDELDWAWDDVLEWKDDLAAARADGASDEVIGHILDKLDDAYEYVDEVANHVSAKRVHDLAHFKADRAQWLLDNHFYATWFGAESLQREINYFDDEAAYEWANYTGWIDGVAYFTQPIAQVGRLDFIRGAFTGDCHHTRVTIDERPVTFIGQDTRETYFMLPDDVTPGPHTLHLSQDPFEYEWPIFVMRLTMSIDIPNLHLVQFPQATKWHLTLAGLNGMPSSYWSSGGFSPDLLSLGGIPKLPGGFQPPNATRQGQILLTATNASPLIISVPELPNGQQTWILDAKKFAPAGEFHLDADAKALRYGDFAINAFAVGMLKPIEARRVMPGWWDVSLAASASGAPFTTSSPKVTPQQVDAARQKFDQLHQARVDKAQRMWDVWHDVINSAPQNVRVEHGVALTAYDKANTAWEQAKAAEDKAPTDANRKALVDTDKTRYETKQTYDHAHEHVLDSVDKSLADGWRRANGDYNDAMWREGMAKEGWEDAERQAAGR